jgi:hypothetical protein
MKKHAMVLGGFVATFALAAAAYANDVKVTLTGAEEVPAVTTSGKGSGTITVKDDMSVSGSVKTEGVMGVAAHIHAAPAGKNGPPIISLTKKGDNEWVVPDGAKLTAEQLATFKAGGLYVNVHSPTNKGGEIRGQLKP